MGLKIKKKICHINQLHLHYCLYYFFLVHKLNLQHYTKHTRVSAHVYVLLITMQSGNGGKTMMTGFH